jgi:CheY-like chemotaxis protein
MSLTCQVEEKEFVKETSLTQAAEVKTASYLQQIAELSQISEMLRIQVQKIQSSFSDVQSSGLVLSNESFNLKPEKPLRGLKILIAEDSPDNQLLLQQYLSIAGAQVEIVANGQAAIEKAIEGDHHVIVMDVMMPICDGYEATRTLRQKSYNKPIIALTAHALKEQREQSFREGCDEHLVKPINRQLLISTIARFAQFSNVTL